MRALSLSTFLLLSTLNSAVAQQAPAADSVISESPLERIFSERGSDEKFKAAIAAAQSSGISSQAILEARFLYYVDRHDDPQIAALLPEFERQAKQFDLEQSEIFATKEDWLAVCEYVRAIKALTENSKDGFKKHITEAFWLSPKQGAAFAPHIERLRLKEAMAAVTVDFAVSYRSLFSEQSVILADTLSNKQALLLQFWSPWSRECEETMPDFFTTATELISKDFAVASILPEDTPEVITDARELIGSLGEPKNAVKPPGVWLIDRKKNSLNRQLRIQSVPIVVLISKEGKILFNGHPAESEFWDTLLKIDSTLSRPMASDLIEEP